MTEKLEEAIRLAKQRLSEKKRRNGESVFDHSLRVMEKLSFYRDNIKITAILHDILEDSDTTQEEIALLFEEEISKAVGILTRKPEMSYADYIDEISRASNDMPFVAIVKMTDLEDNINTPLVNPSRMELERKDKYILALRYLRHLYFG